MKHVALVTCSSHPHLAAHDAPLLHALASFNIITHTVAWDNPSVDWTLFDGIILRSTWNYPQHYSAFLSWLTHVESIQANIFNHPSVLRWNSHKSYLLELAAKGIPIIPTRIIAKNTPINAHDGIQKPAIGNRSQGLTRHAPAHISHNHDMLLQPYMREVDTDGEYQYIFIGNTHTHTMHKTAKTIRLSKAPSSFIHQAAAVIMAIHPKPLYARVDGIHVNDKLLLMELELIEPLLYLDVYPQAAVLMAQTIASYV
jgi:hypothetical protein